MEVWQIVIILTKIPNQKYKSKQFSAQHHYASHTIYYWYSVRPLCRNTKT